MDRWWAGLTKAAHRISVAAGVASAVTFFALICGVASAFVVSHAPSGVVQAQPPPGSCHVRGRYPFNMPDLHCTPGALNPAVLRRRSATRSATRLFEQHPAVEFDHGTREAREPARLWLPSKRLALRVRPCSSPTQLGGAANDRRNLWPENGASPNLKDKVENYLHVRVCDGRVSLARAHASSPSTGRASTRATSSRSQRRTPSGPPDEGIVHPGAFCSPVGATGHTTVGTPMVCGPASDGRNRWHHS